MYCECEFKEPIIAYYICKENANEILNVLGFGELMCKQTYDKDKRYGRVEYDHIVFGFENRMSCRYFFGNYIVRDPFTYGWEYVKRQDFFEQYKIIEETNE